MSRRERIKKWASELNEAEMQDVLVELVDYAIDSEMVSFWDDCLAPYWAHTGDPLVEGQDCYPDEE